MKATHNKLAAEEVSLVKAPGVAKMFFLNQGTVIPRVHLHVKVRPVRTKQVSLRN